MSGEPQQPSDDEIRAAWDDQLRRLTPADLIVQTIVSLINIAGRRLGLDPSAPDERDLGQARDGIDGARALLPVLERHEPPEALAPLREALSTLQLHYARLAGSGAVPAPDAPSMAAPAAPAAATPEEADGPGPAQRSGRLWVPGT